MARFFERARHLRRKLGPVLYQLPPGLKSNLERLYVRFHGYDQEHGGRYSDERLAEWAGWLTSRLGEGRDATSTTTSTDMRLGMC